MSISTGQYCDPYRVDALDVNGFEASWMYWWKENVMLRLWVLQADNDTIDPLRLRFDLNVNFKR